ncbi:MAG: sugar ABC transporter permease [Thermoleophilia bacterium]|nr:sugar ABC transporter permease [Thermoleophilia bacterium]
MVARILDRLDERRLGLLFVIPALLLMAVVAAYPVLNAFWLSLHRYNVKVPDDYAFIGLENYTRILASAHWWTDVKTTFIFAISSVSVEFVLGMCMALVMNKGLGKATGTVRMAVLVPWATITVVTGLAWKWIFTPTSSIGFIRTMMGWVADESCMLCGKWTSMFAMVFADAWKTAPFIALLLLAGLQSIDGEMYEAADVDGASTWTKFLKITLPALKPAILVAVLFRSLDALRVFDLPYVMTQGANGTEPVSMLAYNIMIRRLDIGLGSAMSVLVFAMVLGVAFIFVKVLGATPEGAEGPAKKRGSTGVSDQQMAGNAALAGVGG